MCHRTSLNQTVLSSCHEMHPIYYLMMVLTAGNYPSESRTCDIPVLCVYELGLVCSQKQLCHIGLYNDYIEQLLVSSFPGQSSGCLERTNLISYYMHCARTWCRDLYITGFIMYKFKVKLMLVWMRARRLSGS